MRPPPRAPSPLVEIGLTIVAPSLVLQFGGDGVGVLLAALALPLGYALHQAWTARRVGWPSLLGIVGTLLTGGIGLLQLDAAWFAVKEGALPLAMALVVAASAWTRRPLIHALVFDAALVDAERLATALAARGTAAAFERRLRVATLGLAAIFAATGVASYSLARWVVVSPAGSAAFNAELGRLTLLSYAVVALPALLAMLALLAWLLRQAHRLSGLDRAALLGRH